MTDPLDTPQPASAAFARFARTRVPADFVAAFDATAPDLLLVALRLARHDADDVLQQTWPPALQRAAPFDPSRPLLPWLVGILLREARRARRDAGRRLEGAERAAARQEEVSHRGPDEAAALAEFAEDASAALDSLDATHRQVLILRIRHGLSSVEIGDALGRSPETVRSQLARGLEKLRRLLPEGHALPAVLAADLTVGGQAATVAGDLAVMREALMTLSAPGGATTADGAWSGLSAGAGIMTVKKLGWIAALTLLAALWWVFAHGGAQDPIQPEGAGAPRTALLAVDRTAPGSTAVTRVAVADATPPDQPDLDVLVVDPAGEPIAGVPVFWHAAGARIYDIPPTAGRSDPEGRIRLPRPDDTAGLEVVAGRRGWQTAAAVPAPGAISLRITLDSAVEQSFEVTDVFGDPVSDAVVRLWRRCPPAAQEPSRGERLPGTEKDALFEAVTDEEGCATVAGLPSGEWNFRVAAAGYVPDVQPDGALSVPRERVEIVLEPLVGLFIATTQGRISGVDTGTIPGDLRDSVNPPGQTERLLQTLAYRERHPRAYVWIWGGNDEIWARLRDAPLGKELGLFVDGLGWGRAQAHIRLLGGVRDPEVVEPLRFGGAGQVRLTLVDPAGRRVEKGSVFVKSGAPLSEGSAGFLVELGTSFWLPTGHHLVTSSRGPVQVAANHRGFDVRFGVQDIEVPILTPVRPFELQLRLPDGTVPMSAYAHFSGAEQGMTFPSAGIIRRLVSCKPFAFTCRLSESLPAELQFDAGFEPITRQHTFAWKD